MPKSVDNLQFLICSNCQGLGYVANKKCNVCHGKKVIAYLDDYILFWGKSINSRFLKLYKLERQIRQSVILVLLIFLFLGLFSLGYSTYLSGFNSLLDWEFWTNRLNQFHLYFWLTVLTDLYLIYYYYLEKDKREKVIVKKFKFAEESVEPPLIEWQQLKQFEHQRIVDISKSFSVESNLIIEEAYQTAKRLKAKEVEPIHLLITALINSNLVDNIFARLGVDMDEFARKLGRAAARSERSDLTLFSAQTEIILLRAYRQAYMNKEDEVAVSNIVLESIKADKVIQDILIDLNLNAEKVENVILWYKIKDLLRKQWMVYRASSRLKSKTGIDRAMTALQTPYLNQFAEDLTFLAKKAYLPLCIDRDKEFAEIFRILEGSSIKSIILTGEAGVGKTAIIEGLAQKMIADDVPDFLKDKRLASLSVSRLLSGASVSEAQERLLICLDEIINAGNVVLYIDNIHDLIPELLGTLAEAVSKNLFILIAGTNPLGYKSYIERTALGNTMKKITIIEPEINDAIQILEGKISFIEGKNNVYFSYDALENAVKLTDRYIHGQFLPYKALTILEEVAVWAKKNKGENAFITGNDVATLISEKIGMAVSEITETESTKLLRLEEIIHKRIVDQHEAVSAVANSLRRARTEIREINRPIANLLFLGPTGVGKTELAKAIAEVYYGSEENMVRLDMSEYQEQSSINRLLGAPAGYEGAGMGGILTEAVRLKPFSLVLLDELEKSHPDIMNLFLQVMEDGRLTDALGRTIDFTNVILIATSNAQTAFIQEKVKEGVSLEDIKRQLLETELKQYFKVEFLNRFDNIIIFKPLGMEEVVQITGLMLQKVAKNLEAKGVNFKASDEAINELAQIGFDPQFGARPLRRVIQDKVDNALAEYLLKGKIGRRDFAILEKGGIIRVEKAEQL